jgi:iron complex transport system substrate-binding protein
MKVRISIICIAILALFSCQGTDAPSDTSCRYADYFDVLTQSDSTSVAVVAISPYNGSRDTLLLDEPLDNIICMSTSQVAGLVEIGADSVITAVSGLRYVSNPKLHSREVYDIGYEASLDYERILKLQPDVVLAYTVSGAEPSYISKLRSLGIRVLVLHDHLEDHPLARAEYIRLYGALTGRQSVADSMFYEIASRYEQLADEYSSGTDKVKALLNVPYGDAWYIPGADSYMSRLVSDAGGEVLGAKSGTSISRVISIEEAYGLSQRADIWLNPGPCSTIDELKSFHHSFHMFGPVEKGLPVYNNTLRTTPEGGNDFWESGSVRPDLVLNDLINIFSNQDQLLEYHFQLK